MNMELFNKTKDEYIKSIMENVEDFMSSFYGEKTNLTHEYADVTSLRNAVLSAIESIGGVVYNIESPDSILRDILVYSSIDNEEIGFVLRPASVVMVDNGISRRLFKELADELENVGITL